MSKRWRRLTLPCPACTKPLVIKRSAYKLAYHPILARRGSIVLRYDRTVHTEERSHEYWLTCPACQYTDPCSDESDLKSKIGALADAPPAQPKIVRPSRL